MNRFIILIILASAIWRCEGPSVEMTPYRLWYDQPAQRWTEALPIGNGRLGAMVYSGIQVDTIQFNEETLWNGEPNDYANEGAHEYLDTIRQMLRNGHQSEAEALAMEHFMSVPVRQKAYQPFGILRLEFPGHQEAKEFNRELDLSEGIVSSSYEVNGVNFKKEYLSSQPDQLIAIRISADQQGMINCKLGLSSLHQESGVEIIDDNQIRLNVKVIDGVLKGSAILKVVPKGGNIVAEEGLLQIQEADELVLYLVAATSFISPTEVGADPIARSEDYLKATESLEFEEIKNNHLEEYQAYYNRFDIHLGPEIKDTIPTNQRIMNVKDQMDPYLAALYVQYGRYLLMSSSREGTYPANLQGIWNDQLEPPWDSKYTVNINTEMNYWPAEVLNLPEMHRPLFDMLEEVQESGKKVARAHYEADGWVLHHNTDLWRGAAPINHSNHGIWVTGGAWLAHHFWEHYLFNQDLDFLKNRAYPILKDASLFFLDFLVEDTETGWLISTPSNSPENGGLVEGPAMDHQIIRSLFKKTIRAAEILGIDQEFAVRLRSKLDQVAPDQIGEHGQLKEWVKEEQVDPLTNNHRHVSHLWAVHPGTEITFDTPELMEAARKSLELRGDEGTGWSLAWKINFWARFLDGDHAWQMVKMLLEPAWDKTRNVRGGSYQNLFDAHPPFQIDGNFGGAAGIVELLIQSQNDVIKLLPALPSTLDQGKVAGVKARGGFELDFDWDQGMLNQVKVRSIKGGNLKMVYLDHPVDMDLEAGQEIVFDGDLEVQ